jgi:hypothetical protein
MGDLFILWNLGSLAAFFGVLVVLATGGGE